MKKVLLLLYIALTFSGFSQTNFRFADSSAQWYIYQSSDTIYPIYPHLEKNFVAHVRNNNWVRGNDTCQLIELETANNYCILLKDSVGKVIKETFPGLDTSSMVIYDFSKTTGSIDSIVYKYINPVLTCYYMVDSVDSVLLDRNRKRMFVRYNIYNPAKEYSDVWVDGIGSLYTRFTSPGLRYDVYTGEQTLLCFYEKGVMVYHNPAFDSCTYSIPTAIEQIRNQQSAIRISPNPASTYLTIQLQQSITSATVFQLYDITGRIVLQKPLAAATTRIELNGVSKGMYLYSVVLRQAQHDMQQVGAGKVVVE